MCQGYNSPYLFGYDQTLRKLFRPRKQVQHQQTCPECEQKARKYLPGVCYRERRDKKDRLEMQTMLG